MRRTYDNRLRQDQAAQTRKRILEALIDQLGQGLEDFSAAQAAAAAGVSLRTLYQYFPNREAQLEAVVASLDETLTLSDPGPRDLDDVPAAAERLMRQGVLHLREVRAQLKSGLASEVRARRRRTRDQAFAKAVAAECDPDKARLAAAAVNYVVGGEIPVALIDRYDLDVESAIRTDLWLIKLMVDAIKRGDLPEPVGQTRAASQD